MTLTLRYSKYINENLFDQAILYIQNFQIYLMFKMFYRLFIFLPFLIMMLSKHY